MLTWHMNEAASRWELYRAAALVDWAKYDSASGQYRDSRGAPLGRKWDDPPMSSGSS